ncbi:MAG TPA: hypothetical protein VD861_16690 [Pyrinomonadaceae bacterium]|nr:hypothetical protein [Pyrinomonadaceae bacterium]
MASEKEANRARDEHSDFLRRLGAHSIAVYEIRRGGEKSFAVVAYFSQKPAVPIPETLEVASGRRKLAVPLVAQIMKTPSPE